MGSGSAPGRHMVIRYTSDGPPNGGLPRQGHPAAPFVSMNEVGERLMSVAMRALARLRRRLVMMVLVAALPFAAAFAVLKVSPALYQADASVFIDPASGRPGRADGVGDPAMVAALLRQATSKAVLQKAMDKERLAEDSSIFIRPTGAAALTQTLMALVMREEPEKNDNRAAAIMRMLTEQVVARRAGEANLIEISARAYDPGTAARLANAVAAAFVDEVIAGSDATQGAERARVVTRGEELKKKLRDAEARLIQFKSQNGLDAGTGKPAAGDQDLPAQLSRARAATIDAKAKSDQVQKLLATGKDVEAIADFVRSPSVDRLRVQFNEAAAQEANFKTSLGPRHPAYLEAAEQARERRRLLMEGLRLAASSARADWQAARDQELALEKRLGPDAQQVPAAQNPPPALLREMEREVEIARLAVEQHLKAVAGADAGAVSGIARIVARATPPATAATGGQTAWTIASWLSLILAGLVFAAGRRSPAMAASSRAAPSWGMPPLAVRPEQPAEMQDASASAVQPRRPARRLSMSGFRPRSPERAPEPAATHIVRTRPADPPVKISTRDLAREVADRDGEFALQMALVTGVASTDHKLETALDLAASAARLDVRVLLIDADHARCELSHRYAASPVVGHLALQGRDRLMLCVDLAVDAHVWIVPNEAVRAAPSNDGDHRHYPSITGYFDLVIMVAGDMDGSLALRALARTAQTIVVAVPALDTPGMSWLEQQLGVGADVIRPVPSGPGPLETGDSNAGAPSRPMAVVRTNKCA